MTGSDATHSRDVATATVRLAVPEWQGRVSPVFDVAAQTLVVELGDNGEEVRRHMASLGETAPHERARQLGALGIDVLVCGAISRSLEMLLVAAGIRVVSLLCGPVDDIVKAFREGTLEDGRFTMPGCCRKRQSICNRRRRRRGPTTEDIV